MPRVLVVFLDLHEWNSVGATQLREGAESELTSQPAWRRAIVEHRQAASPRDDASSDNARSEVVELSGENPARLFDPRHHPSRWMGCGGPNTMAARDRRPCLNFSANCCFSSLLNSCPGFSSTGAVNFEASMAACDEEHRQATRIPCPQIQRVDRILHRLFEKSHLGQ